MRGSAASLQRQSCSGEQSLGVVENNEHCKVRVTRRITITDAKRDAASKGYCNMRAIKGVKFKAWSTGLGLGV